MVSTMVKHGNLGKCKYYGLNEVQYAVRLLDNMKTIPWPKDYISVSDKRRQQACIKINIISYFFFLFTFSLPEFN